MDGFTVSNANRFLNTGNLSQFSDSKSMPISGRGDGSGFGIGSSGDASETAKSFADTLNEAVQNVNKLQKESDKAIQNLASGKTDNISEVMVASEKADIAMRLMVQVRNKIIDAYQEVMKMQV